MRNLAVPLAKLLIFVAVTVVFTAILGATIANTNFGVTSGYTARFTDASGLHEGDDVRIAGVKVGQVDRLDVVGDADRALADVHFSISSAYQLPAEVTATVKYRNLIGQRYLALVTTVDGGGQLPSGGLIPPERTQPALNLTVLFNGFKPLFQALDPKQVNQLSYEIIQVFQGEGGTIESLLTHTASVTSAIAGKDKVIGQVIDNLNAVLGTVNQRGPALGELVDQTQQLVTGLARQREPIGDAVSALANLTDVTGDLVRDARPAIKDDIANLGVLSNTLSDSGQLLDELLRKMPGNLDKFTRTLSYGGWYNYYLCGLTGTIGISQLDISLPMPPIPGTETPERCKP
ncbi:MCE family protein [Amycolatopsis pithecellobii]|uniref:MCE family protein n=1 Tax=Amycolatopsis pithecellobii TaxID=664692 RepID=A0A6N7Z1I8_9PSEU|nr:MlaD family protein [Amycolatopsis pithecellobii]MTD53540.1 MCE family protein [Amycolatopsis pithecellobii]